MQDGFTEAVRQELASLPVDPASSGRSELSGLLAVRAQVVPGRDEDGKLSPQGGRLEVTTASGSVARRLHGLVGALLGEPVQLLTRTSGRTARAAHFQVRLLTSRALLDATAWSGSPFEPVGLPSQHTVANAWLRGALLGAGTVSTPGRPPHLEFRLDSLPVADALEALLGRLEIHGHVVNGAHQRRRVVVKSGEQIGALLAATGATNAFLRWDERRLRRQLRSDANRMANADTANVRRAVRAAAQQVADVEAVVARLGWDLLDDELRDIALARLANPSATMSELAALLDPPVSKSTVARRLRRLLELLT